MQISFLVKFGMLMSLNCYADAFKQMQFITENNPPYVIVTDGNRYKYS